MNKPEENQRTYTVCNSFPSPIGKLLIATDGSSITRIQLIQELDTLGNHGVHPLIDQASEQLTEFFEGKRKIFTLPLGPKGTTFQLTVWQALQDIPYGQTMSYKQIAKQIGNPNASRAVGMANHLNPIMIVIPCHRVVGTNGALTGYAAGLDIKQKLLDLEKNNL